MAVASIQKLGVGGGGALYLKSRGFCIGLKSLYLKTSFT